MSDRMDGYEGEVGATASPQPCHSGGAAASPSPAKPAAANAWPGYATVNIGGREFRKFIPFPGPVRDETPRCIYCGQIDEDPYHEAEFCNPIHAIAEKEANSIGRAQREAVLSLSGEWGKAPSHQAAKRLWWRKYGLVDHKHRTDNCWRLTDLGLRVQALLRDSGSDRNGEDAVKTAAECEASQSGPKGIAHPNSGPSHDK